MSLETADEKVQQICNLLRSETLSPAKKEAERILLEASQKAEMIIAEAKGEAAKIQKESKETLKKELAVHETSIKLAINQGLSALKQSIETLFTDEFSRQLEKEMADPSVIAKIINAIVGAIEREGLSVKLETMIPSSINIGELYKNIAAHVKEHVRQESLVLSGIKGGARIRMVDKKVSIDMSEKAMKELLATYLTAELRQKVFG